MNSYPFLDNKQKPIFTSDLAEMVPRVRRERVVDITALDNLDDDGSSLCLMAHVPQPTASASRPTSRPTSDAP